MKKTFYVSMGYIGGYYGRANRVVPVYCTEEELETVASAVGRGYNADACSVSLTEKDAWSTFSEPYLVLWDCM